MRKKKILAAKIPILPVALATSILRVMVISGVREGRKDGVSC